MSKCENTNKLKISLGFVFLIFSASPFLIYLLIEQDLISPVSFYDFQVYYEAALRFRTGASLYDSAALNIDSGSVETPGPYLYPPVFVLPFIPLTYFPFEVAGWVFNFIWFLLLVTAVINYINELGYPLSLKQVCLISGGLAVFQPTVLTAKLGQVNGVLAASLVGVGIYLEKMHTDSTRRTNGILAALTMLPTAVKPFIAPIGAHLLDDWRRLVMSVGIGAGFVIASWLLVSPSEFSSWLAVLERGKGWGTTLHPINRWHDGYYEPFRFLGSASFAAKLLLVISYIGITLRTIPLERQAEVRYIFAGSLALIPLASPQAYSMALLYLVPAIIAVGFEEFERESGLAWVPIICLPLIHLQAWGVRLGWTWILSNLMSLERAARNLSFLQPGLWGNGILFSLIVYRLLTDDYNNPRLPDRNWK